jgi:protein TonB
MPFVPALYVALLLSQTPAQPPDATSPQTAPSADAPKSAPDPSAAPIRRGGGVTPPHVIQQAEPEFSPEARKKKLGGDVLVSVVVDADGNPTDIKVERSLADKVDPKLRKAALTLDAKAIEAVAKYKFTPAMKQGKPVPVKLFIDVNFQIF